MFEQETLREQMISNEEWTRLDRGARPVLYDDLHAILPNVAPPASAQS